MFGRFDAADSLLALEATMRLFTRLTHEVADQLGYEVPNAEQHIASYVRGFADDLHNPGWA